MSNKDFQDFTCKLEQGLHLAEKRMLEEKALRGQDVVVATEDDSIQYIPAREVFSRFMEANSL